MNTIDSIPKLPARKGDAHKGECGTVAVIGGCARGDQRMLGAPALTATAALRAGAGLVRLLTPEPILDTVIALAPSATGVALPTESDQIVAHEAARIIDESAVPASCIAVGPGLGSGDGVTAATLRTIQQDQTPVVVDADALNALATLPGFQQELRAPAILTPHPGEFRRLASSLSINDDPTDHGWRATGAIELAQRLGCIVVLKGAGTVVSDGQQTWTCKAGHPCLATAGSGDVLTGLIAGLVAQFAAPLIHPSIPSGKPLTLFDAACLGVEAHARAGETWAESREAQTGLLAADLCQELPAVLERLRG